MKNPTAEQALKELDAIELRQKELRRIIEEANKPKPITERVFDIPSAIAELGEKDDDVIEYRKLQDHGFSQKLILEKEITLFAKALNEGTVMDWTNTDQRKYYLWLDFSVKPTNSGFVNYVDYYCNISYSVSSRHTYKSEELARHAKKCIPNKYYEYYK